MQVPSLSQEFPFASADPFRIWPPSVLGINLRECENIQNLDIFPSGPSLRNSWPSPLPHFPHDTFNAPGRPSSGTLLTESLWTVLVKAGHGVWCSYLAWLENSSYPHSTQTYKPGSKLSLYSSSLNHEQKDIVFPVTPCYVAGFLQGASAQQHLNTAQIGRAHV